MDYNGPGLPTFNEKIVSVDNNGAFLRLGGMTAIARQDPATGAWRSGLSYDTPVGSQPENGARFVGAKVAYSEENGPGAYSLYGGVEYGKYEFLPNSHYLKNFYIFGAGVDDRKNIENDELDGVKLSTVAPYLSVNAGMHFFDIVGGDKPLLGQPNGSVRVLVDGAVDFHAGLPLVSNGQAAQNQISSNTNGNAGVDDLGGMIGDSNLSMNTAVRLDWKLSPALSVLGSTSLRAQIMDPTVLSYFPIPFMFGVETSGTLVYDKGPVRATIGGTYSPLTITDRDPKVAGRASVEYWAGKNWGFGANATAGIYGGPGETFALGSGHAFIKTPFLFGQDAVWKVWGGVNGQGPDTNNPMLFKPAFGIALNLLSK